MKNFTPELITKAKTEEAMGNWRNTTPIAIER